MSTNYKISMLPVGLYSSGHYSHYAERSRSIIVSRGVVIADVCAVFAQWSRYYSCYGLQPVQRFLVWRLLMVLTPLLIFASRCDTDEAQYRQAAQNLIDSGLTSLGYVYFSL